ncbi:hypothetical protein P5673_022757 [Acropora cervicornis]|uniref:Uncharacterized protein n=1 Tax=Acropora cervicornis TaxID=6130 RepID=A0AAD9UZ84_ACRCE|nr:hypothetical protein P5673_022757 [Acropora cervicornis]
MQLFSQNNDFKRHLPYSQAYRLNSVHGVHVSRKKSEISVRSRTKTTNRAHIERSDTSSPTSIP